MIKYSIQYDIRKLCMHRDDLGVSLSSVEFTFAFTFWCSDSFLFFCLGFARFVLFFLHAGVSFHTD
jgi:hypothetical protein